VHQAEFVDFTAAFRSDDTVFMVDDLQNFLAVIDRSLLFSLCFRPLGTGLPLLSQAERARNP
jgi:hypothetical protein